MTGIPTAGVWFPVYSQRIDIRESTGEILPACKGLIFDLADCELQPIPARYQLAASQRRQLEQRHQPVDLVGAVRHQPTITSDVRKAPSPTLPEPPRPLLLGKRDGT